VLPFRSILCPVDFSDHAQRALRYAVALAALGDSRLAIVAVADPLLVEAAAASGVPHQGETAREELAAFVAQAAATAGRPAEPPRMLVRVGRPAEEIVRAAADAHADLIVMGTHGLGGYRKMFFGSTTEKVLRTAPIPVLAVTLSGRGTAPATDERPFASIERLLVPVDLGGFAAGQATLASAFAVEFDVPLLLLHVVAGVQATSHWQPTLEAQDRIRVARARQALEKLASELPLEPRVELEVAMGKPADEISAVAAERRAGLIVMGLKSPGRKVDPRVGSIAYRILCLAQVPVLAVPPAE
jgi:nucleotide-binding universal stress UspA family protein